MTTLKDRLKQGKDARKNCPRSAQAATGKTNRDPLPLIKRSSEGRVNSLVELRYGRMLVSPFTFYRGNALLQAHDLAGTANMGLVSTICGDSHLMNFGGFATPERNLLFSDPASRPARAVVALQCSGPGVQSGRCRQCRHALPGGAAD